VAQQWGWNPRIRRAGRWNAGNGAAGQPAANAPWGGEWNAPDNCRDELEASLYVTAARGELNHYSLQCTPVNMPRWVTEFVRELQALQKKHEACGFQYN